jgi:hypothetical protein
VQPILVAAGIAVQSQWGGFPQDWVEVHGIPGILDPDTNASLGIASLTAGEMQEYGGNALNPADAVQALTQKIQKSVAACTGCSATDQFIVAGMAQNGFTPGQVGDILGNPDYRRPDGSIKWSAYFAAQSAPGGGGKDKWLGVRSGGRSWNLFQLQLFLNDVLALIAQGWTPPADVNLDYIQCVVSGSNCD